MCGVRKLTRAAYANQRMTLNTKLRQSKDEAEYDDRAAWINPQWRVFIIHVSSKAFGDASYWTWVHGNTPLFSVRRWRDE